MRTTFLMMSAMFLSACTVESADSTTDAEDDDVAAVSQAVIERPERTLLREWRDVAALEQSDPDLFQHSVDLLVDAGATCFATDRDGHCLDIDEPQATFMLKQDPAVDCHSYCAPQNQIPWDGVWCRHSCCIDIIYEICSYWEDYVGD